MLLKKFQRHPILPARGIIKFMKNSKLVIFDFDGVVVNTFSFAFEINKEQFGISEDEYRKKFEGNFYKTGSNIDKQMESPINFDFFALYQPKLMNLVPEIEIIKSIEKLSEQYTLAIVSSTLTDIIHDYLVKFDARNYFQEILGADIEKSKILKINALLESYNIKPSKAVFVTDTSGDIQEAEQCEVKGIAVTWGYHPKATLEKASPFRIVETPEKLGEAISDSFKE